MAITVEELVNIGSLGTRVLAGSEGLDRGIGWAHVCELAAPWEWLGDGDLVMTTGLGIPESPAAQDEYVRRLAGAGVMGVAVGENMYAPPLTPRMYRCADRVGLPLLLTRYEVPFAAMARTIAAANGVEELDRLSHALRVFEHLHLLVDGEGEAALMQRLESEIGCRLHLLDARSLRPVAGSSKGLPASLVAGLAAQPPDPLGRRPSVLRLPEAQGVLVVPVPGPRRLLLVAIPDEGTRPDLTLLHHVTTVLSLEQVTVVAQRERSRRLGASLLAQIVDGRVDPGTATDQLASVGLVGRCVLTASRGDPESDSWAQLHHVLDDDAIP
ncbi:MAG TPA: PucR family transcriptional regulator ligand-binding domain-containing protein, partial [Actinomycetes bacterium]|nr:PucR family transcriptional regulator ligand-binding domain-containing protein [Actinomycetes bacterium]